MGKFRFRGRRRRRRDGSARQERIPLRAVAPNLVTSLAACAGITSIVFSSEGRYVSALVALFVACICDGMDGRIARLLKASSKLGAELDSLADFVNFGVAPAMFMFFWLTGGPSHMVAGADGALVRVPPQVVRLVLGCSLFYALCDCFRLARFNTMLEQPTLPYWKHFFTGVPAPGGAWMVLTPAILSIALGAKGSVPDVAASLQDPYFGVAALLFVGSLMASRLPTISLKSIHIQKRFLAPVMAALLLFVALLVSDFWLTLGIVGFLYVLTVPITLFVFLRVRSAYERSQGQGQCPGEAPAARD